MVHFVFVGNQGLEKDASQLLAMGAWYSYFPEPEEPEEPEEPASPTFPTSSELPPPSPTIVLPRRRRQKHQYA